MKMKLLLATAAAALLVGLVPSPASAQTEVDVTATIGDALLGGTRSLVVPQEATGLTIGGTSVFGLTSSFTAEVVEVLAPGSNGWHVDAQLTNLTGAGGTIPYSAVNLAPGTIATLPLPAGTNTAGGSGAFTDAAIPGATSAARTVFTNTGQVASSYYTATHTSLTNTLSIDLPEGEVEQGDYTGTLTVTLVD